MIGPPCGALIYSPGVSPRWRRLLSKVFGNRNFHFAVCIAKLEQKVKVNEEDNSKHPRSMLATCKLHASTLRKSPGRLLKGKAARSPRDSRRNWRRSFAAKNCRKRSRNLTVDCFTLSKTCLIHQSS